MLTIEQLKQSGRIIQDLAAKAGRITEEVDRQVQAINGDTSRTAAWKGPKLKEIRDAGFELMHPLWTELQARYSELMDEKDPWSVPLNALSLYALPGHTFGSADEAAVRSQILTEMRMMPPLLLRMQADGAAKNRDWARLYLACLALEEKNQPLPTNLAVLPIDNLEAADEVFFSVEKAYREAELSLLNVRGQGQRSNGRTIALGLLVQGQEDLRRSRAAALSLNWDERVQRDAQTITDFIDKTITLDVKGNN